MKATIDSNPRPVRRNQPLTLEEIHRAAPSAFAAEPYGAMSSRYSYIPTSTIIEGMRQAGFAPFAASQSATKIDGKRGHTKHMIRFRSQSSAVALGDTFPEIVLINAHDGSSAYKLMAGLFRLVCANGLVVADSMMESIHVKHTGNVLEQVATGSMELVARMPEVIDAVARWKAIQLSSAEQTAFAEAAHVLRFADAEGSVTTPITPGQLLTPRRVDDSRSDLWSTFNRVQENVLRGGLRNYRRSNVRRVTTRAVTGIDQDVRLNRALWTLTSRMADLKR